MKGSTLREEAAKERRAAEREFDALRLRLTASDPPGQQRNDAKVFILTSRSSGEGVTTISRGLAQSFARADRSRVLLLQARGGEADGGQPEALPPKENEPALPDGKAPKGNGLARLDKDREGGSSAKLLETIRRSGDGALDLLSVPPVEGREVPDQPPWQDDYSELRARYDVIVVDAGALDSRAPYYWAKGSDHVLLVVDSERTSPEMLKRLAKDLKTVKLTLTGVVLNRRDFPIPKWLYG